MGRASSGLWAMVFMCGVGSTTALAARADEKPAAAKTPDKPDKVEKPEEKPAVKSDDDAVKVPFEKYRLENGLEVILQQDHRLPVVAVNVWYHVGAFHEELGKTGFAHLFEHLMFQGTPNVGDDKHFAFLQEAGSSDVNGTTDFDRTNYYEVLPKNELALALWLESDRMGFLMEGLTKAKLDEQRSVVKNERRQAVENAPYGMAKEKLWRAMFPADHPYVGQVIGSMADLDAASLDDVRRFYDTYYAPSNATLTLVGDFQPEAAKALIEKYFKTLSAWPRPKQRTVKAPALTAEVRLDLDEPIASLPLVVLQYFTPALFQPGDAELDVLAGILASTTSSRLQRALKFDARLAHDVEVAQESSANVSVFSISVVVRPGVKPDDVVAAVQSQIELLRDLPPTDEEIARAVHAIERKLVFSLEDFGQRADVLQRYNHFLGDPGFLPRDLERYRHVTQETLLAAVNTYLVKERRAVLVASPPTGSSTPSAPAKAAPAKEGTP